MLEPELDRSGGDNTRPIWSKALEMVERGEVAGIACWNLSRFSRSIQDAVNALKRIEAVGGKLYTSEGIDNTTAGDFMRNVMLSVAEFERARARDGFRTAIASAVDRGIHVGAQVPFGYTRNEVTRKLEIDPERAKVVQGIYDRRSRRQSWGTIQKWTASQGFEMHVSSLRTITANPTYLGQVRSGDLLKEGAHEAIITQRVFDSVQNVSGVRASGTGMLTGTTLLQGVARCCGCDTPLHVGASRYSEGRVAHYHCRNTACDERAFVRASVLDDYVEKALLAFYGGHLIVPSADEESSLAEAKSALEDAQYDLDGWVKQSRLIASIGADAYAERAEELATLVNLAKATVVELEAQEADTTWRQFGSMWATWTMQSRREFVAKEITLTLAKATSRETPLGERVVIEQSGFPDVPPINSGVFATMGGRA